MSEAYLVHHGIKGQKWGVRRFQNEDGSYTNAGKKHKKQYSRPDEKDVNPMATQLRNYGTIATFAALSAMAVSDICSKQNIDSGSAELVEQLAAAGGVIAGAYVAKAITSQAHDKRLANRRTTSEFKSLDDVPRKSPADKTSDNVKVVNPGWPNPGRTSNCMLCTTAMIMREKGYDVQARKTAEGFYEKNIDKLFEGGQKFQKVNSRNPNKVLKQLSDCGDGSYGNFTVTWKSGGGHSIFWKVENGNPVFYDGQNGMKYNNNKLFSQIDVRLSQYSNLTDARPTDLVLSAIESRTDEQAKNSKRHQQYQTLSNAMFT